MKKYLLDTHIFINAYIKPEKIGKSITKIINGNTQKYISAITLIEIAQLFESKPKEFKIIVPIEAFIEKALNDLKVEILNITPKHAQRFYEIQLMKNHKDQYDRMIIAQSASTGISVVSADQKFPLYKMIKVIPND